MLQKQIVYVWKLIPGWLRLKLIRATQHKFTVSAAAIITDESGKVLLLNHALRPFSGWGLPGGFVATSEQPEAAIRREVLEETGLELDDLRMYRVRIIRSHVEILFIAKASGDAEVRSREILELDWFDVDALPEKLSRSQTVLIREVIGGLG